MSRRKIASSPAAVLAVLVLAVGACSGGDDSDTADSDTADSDATDSTPPPTTAASSTSSAAPTTPAATTTPATAGAPTTSSAGATTPSTSAAPTTTTASSTTTVASTVAPTTVAVSTTEAAPPPETGLTLTANGVEPFSFGDDDDTVIEGLIVALGQPKFEGAQTYPIPDGEFYLDAVEEEGYSHPIGRTVCFVNDLCTQFGGATIDALTFTGWEYSSDAAPSLTSVDGITVGSNWNAFADVVTVYEGGCYRVGYGRASGVELTLLSTGDLFQFFDDDGDWVTGSPSPADVSVVNMSAGVLPYFLFDDC